MNTNLSQLIDISNESARYDEYVKEIFADKQILARILKYTLDEFSDVDIETIINNIDEPEVSRIRMEPGYTNNEKIKKLSEEYGLKINTNTERRLEEMCNLSQVLVDKGIEQGIEIGEITGKVCARYEDGMSIAEIAEKSNVSIEVVENILKEKGLL